MASYDMDASPGPEGKVEDSKKISFRFCRECSNLLYPKEDRMSNTLMFACRTCQFSEVANASCIWRNSLKEDVEATAGNVDDVAQDPTVGDSDVHLSDAQLEDFTVEGEEIVPAFCTMCGSEIICPVCDGPSDGGMALEVDEPQYEARGSEENAVEAEKRERALSGARWGS